MASFNFNKLREFLPKDLPQVQLPSMPSWPANFTLHSTKKDDDGSEGLPTDSHDSADTDQKPESEPTLSLADPIPVGSGPKSYLDLVNECDNFPYYHNDPKLFLAYITTYYGLYVKDNPDATLGFVLPSIALLFRGLTGWEVDESERSLTLVAGSNEEDRTRAIGTTIEAMRAMEHFEVLKGWRDELYPVYGPAGSLLMSMERSASALFGIVTYGCHMTAYTLEKREGEEEEMKIWVPRRAANKQTYGGMLDNTVAGGLPTGEDPFECLVRESEEEASLPEEIVRNGAKAVGTVTYFHIRDRKAGGETRLMQPECQFVYDLELSVDVIPKPSDNEVESFELMTVNQVQEAMREGQFKPNCALVLIDFFVRHGIITSGDKGYIEIVARLHRLLEFPTI